MARDYGITNAAPYASAPAVGAAGDTYFNTADWALYASNGSAWVKAGPAQTYARVGRSTNQSIPAGALTTITYDTQQTNQGGLYNAGAPDRLTIPTGQAGFYIFGASGQFSNSPTGGTRRHFELCVDGNPLGLAETAPGDIRSAALAAGAFIAVGSVIQFIVYHDATAALNFLTAGGATVPALWAARIL